MAGVPLGVEILHRTRGERHVDMSRGMPVIVVAPVVAFTETTEMLSNRIESRPSPLSAPSSRML